MKNWKKSLKKFLKNWKAVKRMAQEKNFEQKVKAVLKNEGCYFLKYWGGGFYTKEGVPDLLVCCAGQFMGIEIKAADGKPTLLQLKNLEQIRNAGGWGILLYPKDFDQLKTWIQNRVVNKGFYLQNIELQNRWKAKLEAEERGNENGKEKRNSRSSSHRSKGQDSGHDQKHSDEN